MNNRIILIVFTALTLCFGCKENTDLENQPETIEKVKEVFSDRPIVNEKYRPQYHFTPPTKWMNDPNGMVYYDGEYHLFYQYYPDDIVWGPMHWGHAVSTDLVNWEHLPIALYPDSLGLIFSGSALIDWDNTSGFGTDGEPPMIAIFTHHSMEGERSGRNDFQYQSIAYSNDKGRTWTKYAGNPVVPNSEKIRDFRDPKVIWDKGSKQWVMVFDARDRVKIYGSPNLKDWTFLSDFGMQYGNHDGVWECPDLFTMEVEGTNKTKWVLLQSINPGGINGGSATQYFVGEFDGKDFILDPSFEPVVSGGNAKWLDYGRDNYAGVTWSDIPDSDGRRIFIGWMSNWDYATLVPTTSWRSAMTIPRELKLVKSNGLFTVTSTPVEELTKLRALKTELQPFTLDSTRDITSKLEFNSRAMEVDLEFESEGIPKLTLILSNHKGEEYSLGYDAFTKAFFSDRSKSGEAGFSNKFIGKQIEVLRNSNTKTVKMLIYFDVASCEIFADNGETVLTNIYFPSEDFNQVRLKVENGEIQFSKANFYQLR